MMLQDGICTQRAFPVAPPEQPGCILSPNAVSLYSCSLVYEFDFTKDSQRENEHGSTLEQVVGWSDRGLDDGRRRIRLRGR